MSSPKPTLTLYTYFRSSAAGRARTILELHNAKREDKFVHLVKDEQKSDAYAAVNPSGLVPTLAVTEADGSTWYLSQSAAILEYVDEVFGATSPVGYLLPRDPRGAAAVRAIVNIIVCDTQPLANLRTMQYVEKIGDDKMAWAKHWTTQGLIALEKELSKTSKGGKFCYDNRLTLADVALAPQMYSAIRFGCNLADYPTVNSIFQNISKIPQFVAADWRHQPDTPDEFRV